MQASLHLPCCLLFWLQADKIKGFLKQQKQRTGNTDAKTEWLLASQQLQEERWVMAHGQRRAHASWSLFRPVQPSASAKYCSLTRQKVFMNHTLGLLHDVAAQFWASWVCDNCREAAEREVTLSLSALQEGYDAEITAAATDALASWKAIVEESSSLRQELRSQVGTIA